MRLGHNTSIGKLAILVLMVGPVYAEDHFDAHLRRHRSPTDRRLVNDRVVLTLDDGAQRMVVNGPGKKIGSRFEVPYADVTKVIFEGLAARRDYSKKGSVAVRVAQSASPLAGMVAEKIARKPDVRDHACLFELQSGAKDPVVLMLDEDQFEMIEARLKTTFASKVETSPFAEGAEIDRKTLPEIESKHTVKTDRTSPPFVAQVQPNEALIVVVAPAYFWRTTGKGRQYKIHLDGHVAGINVEGTWTAISVPPGEHTLVSQVDDASSIKMTLEAGQEYYFLQHNSLPGAGFSTKEHTVLMRHTKDYVLIEASGAYRATWKLKPQVP